jgi:hypothetical protein
MAMLDNRQFHQVPLQNERESLSVLVYEVNVCVEERSVSWTSLSYGQNYDTKPSFKIVCKHHKHHYSSNEIQEALQFDECLTQQSGHIRISRTAPFVRLPVQV